MHILLADDTLDTRALYALAFRMEGHTVRVVEDGTQAVAAVEEEAFDVVLLDIQMPIMDGWEALSRINQLPGGRSLPIALFSAFITPEEIVAARDRDAITVFLKPIAPSEMLVALHKLMVRYNSEEPIDA